MRGGPISNSGRGRGWGCEEEKRVYVPEAVLEERGIFTKGDGVRGGIRIVWFERTLSPFEIREDAQTIRLCFSHSGLAQAILAPNPVVKQATPILFQSDGKIPIMNQFSKFKLLNASLLHPHPPRSVRETSSNCILSHSNAPLHREE
ncbi:hypothetical protein CEXT_721211 [Caerostris extrusa]|uniref:Uncharacterized protein n=1 Tax=Caerostris extrusa TaxID=172846 RepID=A0AAV4RCZ0_CAEEX|nr:hypothetical protein CEXT_721211 [Caerostris extrusa]